MTLTLDIILLVAAAICFGLAALNINSPVGLVPLGLLLFIITLLTP